MKKRNRKKKINIQIICIILIILSLIGYMIVNLFIGVSQSIIKTELVELGKIDKYINKDVVIVRDEIPIISKSNGIFTSFYSNGERVKKNAVIGKIQDSTKSDNEIVKLEKINIKIEQLQNLNILSKYEQQNILENDINYIYLDIQNKIKNNDFSTISKLKTKLNYLENKKDFFQEDLNSTSLNDLYAKKNQLEQNLAKDKRYLRSPIAGCLSYYHDEYENVFNFKNLRNLTVNEIDKVTNKVKSLDLEEVKENSILGYIVNNHAYYMVSEIDKNDVEHFKRDLKLKIIVENSVLESYFYDFYKDKNGKFVGIFKVTSEDFDYLQTRKATVKIIYDSKKGILIPNSAIKNVNGQEGVFIVNNIGEAKFIKLYDVLSKDEKNTIIKFSYDNFNSSNKINLYDKIIINPKNIEDGQKVK